MLPGKSRQRLALLAVGALLAAGFFAVHLPWLRAGLWRDEAVSVYVGWAHDLSSYFHRYAKMDYAPPLFDGIVGGWGRLFGWEEGSLASLAAIGGLFAVGAAGWAAFEIAGPWAAPLAALFAASSDVLFWEVDQVRPYAFSAGCAGMVLAIFARRWKKRNAQPGSGLGFVFPCALLAFSHYAGTLAVASLGAIAILGLRGANRDFWRTTLLGCAIPGVLLLPWIPAALRQLRTGLPWNPHPSFGGRIAGAADLASSLIPRWGPHGPIWSVLPAVLVLVGCAAAVPVRRELARMGLPLAIAATWGLLVVAVMGISFGVSRYVSIAAACSAIAFACLFVGVGRALIASGVRATAVFALGLLIAAGPVVGEWARVSRSQVFTHAPARSGIRAMLAALPLRGTDLFVAAPSYLAPTLWYYGVRGPRLRGYPQWERPEEVDYERFPEIRTDPASAANCAENVLRQVSAGGIDRIVIVTDLNPAPEVRRQVGRLVSVLASRIPGGREGIFHGYPETVRVFMFDVARRP